MLPFMKLLPYIPDLMDLIDDGWTFTVARDDVGPALPSYVVGATKGTRTLDYAASRLDVAIETFVTQIARQIRERP